MPTPVPSRATKAVIQSAAEKYAERIGFRPGGDIRAVVEGLGGRIVYRDFFLVPGRSSESIRVRAQNDFEIALPHETGPARDRFTIAHELGHLLLHYPLVVQSAGRPVEMVADRYLADDAPEDVRRCEWEANWFAAAFLMPSMPFRASWAANAGNAEAVAREFQVSSAAARNRAQSLGL